jgi:hypothetical protein
MEENGSRLLFLIFNSLFYLIFQVGENKLERNTYPSQKKYEILHGGRLEYLLELLYWAL